MTDVHVCPDVFVVPDDPLNPYNICVSVNCTYPCRDPTLTSQEHKVINSLVGDNCRIGASLIFCLIVYLIKTGRWKKRYILTSMTVTSFLLSISMSLLISSPEKLCYNNAVGYRNVNGLSECVVQGALIEYSALASTYSIAMQSIELFSMVVLNKTWHDYWLYQLGFIFAFPLVSVTITACLGTFGLARMSPYCLTPTDPKQDPIDILTMYGPLAISVLLAFITTIAVLLTIFRTVVGLWRTSETYKRVLSVEASSRDRGGYLSFHQSWYNCGNADIRNYLKSLLIFRTPFLFLLMFVAIFTPVFQRFIESSLMATEVAESLETWIACIFCVFDGTPQSNQRWRVVCGAHPKVRVSPYQYYASVSSQAIQIALVFLPYGKAFTWIKRRLKQFGLEASRQCCLCINWVCSCIGLFYCRSVPRKVFPGGHASLLKPPQAFDESKVGEQRAHAGPEEEGVPRGRLCQVERASGPPQLGPHSPHSARKGAAWEALSSSDGSRRVKPGSNSLRPFSSIYSIVIDSRDPAHAVVEAPETLRIH